jgi:hypothetical protein
MILCKPFNKFCSRYAGAHLLMKTIAEKTTKRGKVMGRPVKWPPDHPVWYEIVHKVSAGKSLSTLLSSDKSLPDWVTFYRMLDTSPELRKAYEKAVQDRADRMVDEILELADEEMPEGLEGSSASAWVQRKRMQVDARKWVASKFKPKMYGDRLDVSVTDERISVLGALNAAKTRVLENSSDIVDVNAKVSTDSASHIPRTPLC